MRGRSTRLRTQPRRVITFKSVLCLIKFAPARMCFTHGNRAINYTRRKASCSFDESGLRLLPSASARRETIESLTSQDFWRVHRLFPIKSG